MVSGSLAVLRDAKREALLIGTGVVGGSERRGKAASLLPARVEGSGGSDLVEVMRPGVLDKMEPLPLLLGEAHRHPIKVNHLRGLEMAAAGEI